MSRVAVLKGGRSLERQVSLRSGGARRGRARAPRPRRRRRSTSAPTWSTGCATSGAGRRVRRAARPRTARTAPSRSCSSCSASRTPARGPGACMRCMDKVLAKHVLRDAGHADARVLRLQPRPRSATSAPREALPAIEERLGFPIVVKPARGGLGAGDQVRARRRRRARARWSPPSPTTRGSCSSATSTGATSRSRCSRTTGERAAGRRGRARARRTSTTSRRATRSARTEFVCPADAADDGHRARAGARASTSAGCSAATASRAST